MSARSAIVVAALCGLVLGTACAPPLRITTKDDCAVVSVQSWGEYYTTISEVTLTQASDGKLVWSAHAVENAKPKLHFIKVCAGANPATPEIWGDSGSFKFEVASGATSFDLRRGVEYTVRVQSPSCTRSASRSFVF